MDQAEASRQRQGQLDELRRHRQAQEEQAFVDLPPEMAKTLNIQPGRVRKELATLAGQLRPKPAEPFKLAEGEVQFGPGGQIIAEGRPKTMTRSPSLVDVQSRRLAGEGQRAWSPQFGIAPGTPEFDIELGRRMEKMIPVPFGGEVQTPTNILRQGTPLYERELSPEQAGALGVPSGTRPSEATGRMALTGAQRTKVDAQSAVLGMVDKMERDLSKFAHPPNPLGRLLGTPGRLMDVYGQADAPMAAFHKRVEGTLALIVRALGEVGTLTDKDLERARSLQPVVAPIPDTADVIREKIQGLRELVQEVASRTGSRPETIQRAPSSAPASKPAAPKGGGWSIERSR
jgi:hypothetical protein